MKDITPRALRCHIGACPAVYKDTDGSLVIIGKRDLSRTAKLIKKGKVNVDEDVITIPEEYLQNVFDSQSKKQ